MPHVDVNWLVTSLDWSLVEASYDARLEAHRCLVEGLSRGASRRFAELALGMTDPPANYSANEHGLGPKILASNPRAVERVWKLARDLSLVPRPTDVPRVIQAAGLAYCRVGVGSELSSLLKPEQCWVCNVRTLWTALALKHADLKRADEELRLYKEQDPNSEMYWPIWGELHRGLVKPMRALVAASEALRSPPVRAPFLWADAICNVSYQTLRG